MTDHYILHRYRSCRAVRRVLKLLSMTCLLIQPGYAQQPVTVWLSDFCNEAFARLHVTGCEQYAVQKGGKLQLQESSAYDLNGYLISKNLFVYDSLGELSQQRIKYDYRPSEIKAFHIQLSAGKSDTLMIQTLHFDSLQRLQRQVVWKEYSNYTTVESFTYDDSNHCLLVSLSGNGGSSGERRYEMAYDPQGNLLRVKHQEEITEENTYDDRNRLVRRNVGHCQENFRYDNNGHLSSQSLKCTDPDPLQIRMYGCNEVMYTYRYNRKNQLTYAATECLEKSLYQLIGFANQTHYVYDTDGLLSQWKVRSAGYRWRYMNKYTFAN
jgi:YD repeat-containing protein